MIVDLGAVYNITSIDVQGRPFSGEHVTEFSISYGYNGLDYADYKEPGGNIKVKEETKNEDSRNLLLTRDSYGVLKDLLEWRSR